MPWRASERVFGPSLLLDHRPIVSPNDAPAAVQMVGAIAKGIFGGELLVNFDSPARRLSGVEVAVFESCAALEDFGLEAGDDAAFLDAEVGAGKVEVQLGRMAHRRDIAWAVPCGLHAVHFAENGDLPCRRQPSGLREVNADVIDQPALDQRLPLVLAV